MGKSGTIVILCLIAIWLCLPLTVVQAEGNVNGTFSVDTLPPAPISLSVTEQSYTTVTLSWIATGDDGNTGKATEYAVRYSKSVIDSETKWQAATRVVDPPIPEVGGYIETFVVTGLNSCSVYYFAIKAADEASNWSGLSNSPYGRTLCSAGDEAPDESVEPSLIIKIDVLGKVSEYLISNNGEILETIDVTSEEGLTSLTIGKGTIAKRKDGTPLAYLKVIFDEDPHAPSEGTDIFGPAYDFRPDGATFHPPMTLACIYDPFEIADGVDEEDLVLAYFDKQMGKWVGLESNVDAEANWISAKVSHFTTFAILAKLPPHSPSIKPATFEYASLNISPSEADIGGEVIISVLVANTGGEPGSHKVTLKIDGIVEAVDEVTINAGASEWVTFTTSRDMAGTYSIEVDGLQGSFKIREKLVPVMPTVLPDIPRATASPIGSIIVVVSIMLGVGILLLAIRKRKAIRY